MIPNDTKDKEVIPNDPKTFDQSTHSSIKKRSLQKKIKKASSKSSLLSRLSSLNTDGTGGHSSTITNRSFTATSGTSTGNASTGGASTGGASKRVGSLKKNKRESWKLYRGRNGGGRLNVARELRFKEKLLPLLPKEAEDSFKQRLTKQYPKLLKNIMVKLFPLRKIITPTHTSSNTFDRCVLQERSNELLSLSIAYRIYSLGLGVEIKTFQGRDAQLAHTHFKKRDKSSNEFLFTFKGKGAIWICTDKKRKHHTIHLESQVVLSFISPVNKAPQVLFQSRHSLEQDPSELKSHSRSSRSTRDDHAQRALLTRWSEGLIKAMIPCLTSNISQQTSKKKRRRKRRRERRRERRGERSDLSVLTTNQHKCLSL